MGIKVNMTVSGMTAMSTPLNSLLSFPLLSFSLYHLSYLADGFTRTLADPRIATGVNLL